MSGCETYYGVVRVGAFRVAIPASVLQEVVPRPECTPLPQGGALALGTFRSGGHIVPAYDVLPVLEGANTPPEARRFAAILNHDGVRLALAIDEMAKVARLDGEAFSRVAGGDASELPILPHYFWDEENHSTVGVLDIEALLRMAPVRGMQMPAHGTTSMAAHGSAPILSLALFTIGERKFGVDIRAVREALHGGTIEAADLSDSVLFGFHRAAETLTPVIRLAEFLGLTVAGRATPKRGLVIERPDEATGRSCCLGFLIDEVVGTIQVPESAIHPLQASGLQRAEFYRGVLHDQANFGSVIVLDSDKLLREESLARLARERTQRQREKESEYDAPVPFVVYRTGAGMLASALHDLEAVVPLEGMFALGRAGEPFLGVMKWREQALNLLDLSVLLGAPPEAGKEVLIVRVRETLYGFRVSKVESLASARAEAAPVLDGLKLNGLLGQHTGGLAGRMIHVRKGAQRTNVNILDLKGVARVIAGQAAPPTIDSNTPLQMA